MVEVWDLARHVEAHPDEHDQRWRLAKKLYAAWEYRLALEHLEILKDDWRDRVNVLRYLGATYYRLGRYDEACRELTRAIETWPDEVSLREQLARVLEVAGKREDAADVWDKIIEVDPEHPFAGRASRRLRERTGDTPREALSLQDSDSGIDLPVGRECPSCGARNGDEFDRCWQCHANLSDSSKRKRPTTQRKRAFPKPSPMATTTVVGGAIVVLACIGLYMTLRQWDSAHPVGGASLEALTVREYLTNTFLTARIVTGLIALLLWPLVWWFSFALIGILTLDWLKLIGAGALLAVLLYAGSWVPPGLTLWVPVVVAAASFAAAALLSQLQWGRAVGVWLIQGVVMTILLTLIIASFTGIAPLREAGAIMRHAARHDAEETPGVYSAPTHRVPFVVRVAWESTGSTWLDERTNQATLTLTSETDPSSLRIWFGREDEEPSLDVPTAWPYQLSNRMAPGNIYMLRVERWDRSQRDKPIEVDLTVHSLLHPKIVM